MTLDAFFHVFLMMKFLRLWILLTEYCEKSTEEAFTGIFRL